MSAPANYLGISLGVRRLGMAVSTKEELIDWQIKIFDETYSKKKVKKIWRAIEGFILRYNIQTIGMKLPQSYSRSAGITQCLKYISEEISERNIVIYFYDLEAIEMHFLKRRARDKEVLALSISDKYPELKKEYFKLKKCQYHIKTFEAVGTLNLVLRDIQK